MNARHAFTLIELLAVAAIMTLIAGLLLPSALASFIVRQRIQKEDAILADLKRDIETSFETRDLDTFNLSAFSADIDASSHPTQFSTSTAPTYPAVTGYEWFARLARIRGFSIVTGHPADKTFQPALYDVLFNDGDRPRLLIAAPAEPDKQRYLLMTVIGRDDELVLPPYQATAAWFNAIWDTPWDRYDSTLPGAWVSALTPAQVTNWNTDTPGKSRLFRLRVVRITQRRHDVVINCLHPTDSAWVAYNTNNNYTPGSTAAPTLTFAPASGANTLSGLLAGRVVKIWVGDSWPNAKGSEVTVRERAGYVVQ